MSYGTENTQIMHFLTVAAIKQHLIFEGIMPDSCLCQFRTGVLLLGFMLGSFEVTLAVIFYTFKAQFQAFVGYKVWHSKSFTLSVFTLSPRDDFFAEGINQFDL